MRKSPPSIKNLKESGRTVHPNSKIAINNKNIKEMRVLNKEKITGLDVFDFDGTLVNTELPQTGKIIWAEETGTPWPHRGWWGREESLSLEVFEQPANPKVVLDWKDSWADESKMVIMLTGRMPKLSNHVEAILQKHNLKFDRYLYNYGGRTLENKLDQMSKILKEFPTIKTLRMWDDRDEHVPTFKQWGNGLVENGRLDEFVFTHVISDNHK